MRQFIPNFRQLDQPSTRAAVAFVLAFGLVVAVASRAADVTVGSLEAEAMALPASGGQVVSDGSASGGKAVALTSAGAATGIITTTAPGTGVQVVAKGYNCKGPAKLTVVVDGSQVMQPSVGTSWATYAATKNLSTGSHSVAVALANPYSRNNCYRSVTVDVTRVTGTTVASTSPTATPTPTPTPNLTVNRKIYGTNNTVGWGQTAQARSSLGVNGDRVCQDETNLDSALATLASNGMYFSMCVNSYEGLSSLNQHRQDYANLTAGLAAKYGPGGTYWNAYPQYAGYGVQTFELMNEPYAWWFRGGDNDPASYAHIAAAAIQAGRAANPQAKFYVPLAPGDVRLLNGSWINWNAELLKAEPNLFNLADGFSIHLYNTPTQFASILDNTKTWAWSQAGGNGKPFVITEGNLTDQYASPETDYVNAMPQFVQIADSRTWVKELFIFVWHGFSGRDYLGFLDSSGNPRQARIDAYRNAIQQAQAN